LRKVVRKNTVIDVARISAIAGLLLAPLLVSNTVRAELRCDCSQIIASCSAELSITGNDVDIKSSSTACSRVDYLIDGQPYTALIVDGATEFSLGDQPQTKPQMVVENCRVCADAQEQNVSAGESPERTTAELESATVGADVSRALVKVMPDYPRLAWGQGLEGSVTVEFTIGPDGVVQNIKLIDSSNPVFVTPALDAVSRFRYPAKTTTAVVREEFIFRLLNGTEPIVASATL